MNYICKGMSLEKNTYCKCLYYSSNALSRIITKMAEEEFAVVNLAPSYAFIVMTVNRNPGLQAGELAQTMMLTPSTITRLLEKLESLKLIKRITEGRITQVFPTKASMDINDGIKNAWANLYRRYADLLGEEFANKLTENTYVAALKLTEK